MSKDVNAVHDISLLYELSLAVGTSLDLEENAANFLRTLIDKKKLTFSAIWLHGKFLAAQYQNDKLYLFKGFPKTLVRDLSLAETHPLWEKLQESPNCCCTSEDPNFDKLVHEHDISEGAIGVLRLGDIGFLKMYDKQRTEPFPLRELEQLHQVANKFTTSLKGAMSHQRYIDALASKTSFAQELAQKKQYLQSVNTFATSLLTQSSIAHIAWEITNSVIDKFGFEDCIVYLLDEAKGMLTQTAAYGPKSDAAQKIVSPIQIPIGKGIVGTVAQTGKPELIGDTSLDPRYIVDDAIRYSELAVPIIADGKVLGVIDSEHSEKHFFTEEHKETLLTIAGLASTKIKNALGRVDQETIENALVESEKKLRSIIDSALDAVITIDHRGDITEWNKQAEGMFGWKKEEVMGKPLVGYIIPHAMRTSHNEGMANFFKTGEGPVLNNRIEVPALNKEGKEFPVELSIVPIKTQDTYKFSAFVRDITQQKEEENRRERLMKELEKANHELKDFAYVVSHDLKAPLRAIGSLAHWIEEDYGEHFDKEGKEQLSLLIGRVGRMHELINGILDYSRVGRINIEKEEVDLNEAFQNMLELLAPPQHITVTQVGTMPLLFLNKVRIQQVFQNLVSNAIKYLDKPIGEIEVGCKEKDSVWEFWVKDNGPGIEEKYYDKIFRIFQTLKPRDEIEATGIGLSIVRKIVNLYGGTIWVESAIGEGSTFFFTLLKHK